jgi:PAS domain S-box-containing protein
MSAALSGAQPVLLSTAPATRADWRVALPVVLLSLAVFLFVVPFAKQQLGYVWAFIPTYQAALAITDLLTAGLLLAQFNITRSRALLVLGCGYLFSGCMVVLHTLSYPGLFSELGLLPWSGTQTTAWLYMFWHGGFPLILMAYAWLKESPGEASAGIELGERSSWPAILCGIAAVLGAVAVLALLATAGLSALPPLVNKGVYTVEMFYISKAVWLLSLAGLVALAWRRPYSVLDLWLMVVLCAWLCDVALSAALNGQRFDLGFYAGRVYGFMASAFVLLMMQFETAKMYARLASLLGTEQLGRRREAELRRRIFDTSLDLILVTDRKGYFTQVSPSVKPILGFEPREMLDHSAVEYLYAEDLQHTRENMRAIRRGRGTRTFETRYAHKDGHLVTLAWTGVWSEPERQYFFIGRDMTDQKRAEELASRALARQQAVFNSAMVGIITLNESGSVETMNPAAERIFKVTEAEVARRDIGRLIDLGGPNDVGSGTQLRRMVVEDESLRELTGTRSDRSTFPLNLEISEMPVGERRLFVAFVRDISTRKRHESLKGEFVATVSHELRTPMTSIAGSLGLLVGGAAGALPDPAKRLLSIAHNNSQRLVRLINDILDIEKIESGKMVFSMEPVELKALTAQAIEANRGFAESFGVTVQLDPNSDEAVVRVDPDRVTQVVINLLSNAVKFSPRGREVLVGIENKGTTVRLTVQDHGPGVPDDYRERIFEKFVQVDASDARQKGGTGLGLSIVKQIMLRLGGEVGLEPAPDGGSIFHVELPCWDHIELLETERLSRNGNALILLCEDDQDAAAVLAGRLRGAGFTTEVAYTAEEAVKGAATRSYAAILVDLQLPDSDGISLIKNLRAQPRYHNTPIVVVSADPKRGRDDKRSSTLNVLDWLQKPVDTERLLHVLSRPIVRDNYVRPRILHLDDDRDVLRLVAQALGSTAEVVSVESIDEARHVLDTHHFDLAVLDVGLAEGFGLDLLPDLTGADGRPIPVVVFSAQDSPEVAARVLAVLSKSRASIDSLVATLRRLVAGQVIENRAIEDGGTRNKVMEVA